MENGLIKEEAQRSLFTRFLLTILMAIAYHVSGTLLLLVAVLQFGFVALSGTPSRHLLSFGISLGRYYQQIVRFFAFASEDAPFPFNDWPSSDPDQG